MQTPTQPLPASGLDQVIACETRLSQVDGRQGSLLLRGWPLQAAIQNFDLLGLTQLLWQDLVPEKLSSQSLGKARVKAFAALTPFWPWLKSLPPLEALRAGLSLLPGEPNGQELLSASQVLLAGWIRLAQGLNPLPPDPEAEALADFGSMLQGQVPDPAWVKALGAYWISVSDHGLNASTFTARVIASTRSDLRSALLGAIGALKGPLHGGAPGPVLDMLDAIGHPDQALAWIQNELKAGRRLMGFGHRIYQVRDPRADVLQAALQAWQAHHDSPRLKLAQAVEALALEALTQHKPERPLATNVEFYTALLLEALGFERQTFTAVFALGRTIGWVAHYYEQIAEGRLIRPQSRYIGPNPTVHSA
ncbi:citrate synthase/methylcitrate synthase [bacterium (Candidatus Blackallbacteria) CG17_big_fil_post_rev_8_21_14_2_50_48_46]|uniref:citrate synthase (unknown stereospecificity) n=1 Tax=bacterium (Candidatus Blackallbacteria) CG17_big_fil_post_rev_8_21_14_2_50_48_46 TaxID=2014261 RepID=A0A2M7G2V7_9BACT|nr:MAG: citrate synthase/methylcitrate synthase [bacterium (Candidatus Blackallbacteria) CG18_big_fil_WC_8_21_14_2_50_49_26]PIW16130.1 MAG: citrate synthase/methylcitrate synthase [bacterium (Candidatus Blackallbacteria) CG17_big_fil_post_rev_8_21_14_2_50_48_46]PIW45778.1 MAG: citrate synthase/methylcitrate synthase [bacterium (Candidatus Blackallbacteria) CG13_big_fil_rev_8_21_14_2_50_49_14]